MRFFTVPDARQARRSVAYAATIIAFFMTLVFFIGTASIVVLDGQGQFFDEGGRLIGGSNMVALYTSQVLGGDYFFGFISAVAFATILAVVSGLTLSASSAVSHDLYAQVLRHGVHDEKTELRISRIATVVIGAVTIMLSLALAYAEVLGADDIFIGVNAVDYSGYPDCRPEFIEAYQAMARLATKAGVEGGEMTIHTPLIDLAKAEIIQRGTALGVDYSMTVSCYQADREGRACGVCDSCRIRRDGFAAAGLPDPTPYQ